MDYEELKYNHHTLLDCVLQDDTSWEEPPAYIYHQMMCNSMDTATGFKMPIADAQNDFIF